MRRCNQRAWRFRLGLALTLAAATWSPALALTVKSAADCPANTAQILILGSYHMNNPGLDAINTAADDVLSSRRQTEIAQTVDRLGGFHPTKIMIEAPYRDVAWTTRYQQFAAGKAALGRNEIEQVGFRLAALAKSDRLYGVDFPMMMSGLTYSEVEFDAPQKGAAAATPAASPAPPPELSDEDLLLRRLSVGDYLKHLNDPARFEREHASSYVDMLSAKTGSAIYEKADLLTNWYKRNFRIFSNIARQSSPGDHVILIIGSGHLKILNELADESSHFCNVSPLSYL
jgi:hypothetical protein